MKLGETLRQLFFGQPVSDNSETMLHRGWEQRDEGIYPALFGPAEGPPKVLTESLFRTDFGRQNIHPFWLHHGVMTFPPTEKRATWLYATSGMSNAFDNMAEEWSGLGVEFIMETREKADWATDVLAWLMGYNLLVAIGHYDEIETAKAGSLTELQAPLDGDENCALKGVIALTPTAHPAEIQLLTGRVELLQMVGISESEAGFIQEKGSDVFAQTLEQACQGLITDTARTLIT